MRWSYLSSHHNPCPKGEGKKGSFKAMEYSYFKMLLLLRSFIDFDEGYILDSIFYN
jgi:hypothetical protein